MSRCEAVAARVAAPLLLAAVLIASASGCAAWRAATRVPVYEQTRQARRHIPTSRDVWVQRGDASIFTTLESPLPYYEDESLPVRMRQRSGSHWVLAGPALVIESAYLLVASPVLFVAGLVAADSWYLTEEEPSIDGEVTHWTIWPWWLLTRPVYLIDWIVYDVPTVLFVFPWRVAFHWGEEAGWSERVSDEPEDGRPRREPSKTPDNSGWREF